MTDGEQMAMYCDLIQSQRRRVAEELERLLEYAEKLVTATRHALEKTENV